LRLLQREVADKLGCDEATVHNWEINRTSPQLRFIPRIIQFLGYMPDDTQVEGLGQQIVAARRRLGLSQRELARRLVVDPSTLGRWERNEGRPDASESDVQLAAQQIGGGEWVQDLPDGLLTDVGERGSRLSMGQRQLVALARVVLQDAAIFVLDEATASVDPFTEAQIQQGLDLVMRQRTSIVIAHRIFTVRNAHRIIVLRAGEIIEEGNQEQLMAQGGHYAELYNTYFRHQSLDYIESARELAEK